MTSNYLNFISYYFVFYPNDAFLYCFAYIFIQCTLSVNN